MMVLNKIQLKTTCVTFLMLSAFIPTCFNVFNDNVDLLTMIVRVLVISFSLFIFVLNKDFKVDQLIFSIFIGIVVVAIPTIFNNGNFVKYFGFAIDSIGFVICFKFLVIHYKLYFFNALKYFSRLIIYLNLILMIIYPNGIYISNADYFPVRYNLLDMDNQAVAIIVPLFIIAIAIEIYTTNKKLIILLDCTVFTISMLWLWCATGIIAMMFFIGLIIYNKYFKNNFNLKKALLLFSLIFILIVVLKSFELFSFIIVNILKKDITLSGRTYIWASAIEAWLQHPFLGYGYQSTEAMFFSEMLNKNTHAHNQVLQILLYGGISYLLCFINIFRVVQKKADLYMDKKAIYYLCVGVICYLIMSLADAYGHMIGLYFLLSTLYYLPSCNINCNFTKKD